MTSLVLHVIFVVTLLMVVVQTSSFSPAAARRVRCIGKDELKNRTERHKRYWSRTSLSKVPAPAQDARSCAQAAKETHGDVNNRSLSPWRYYYNQDPNRFPDKISFAQCLCRGCIIRQQEELAYNSVLVFSDLRVLKKTQCPFDPKQFVVEKEYIKVPVACTCVVPKVTK